MKMLYFFTTDKMKIYQGTWPGELTPDVDNATDIAPPDAPQGQIPVFTGSEWKLMPLYTGDLYSKSTGKAVYVPAAIEGYLPDDCTDQLPIAFGKWDAALNCWVVSVDLYRAPKLAALQARWNAALNAGFPFRAEMIQCDDASNAKIQQAGLQAMIAKINGVAYSVNWGSLGGSLLELDREGAISLSEFAHNFSEKCYLNQKALKNRINTAETVAAIDAVDIAQGWPEKRP